MSSKVIKLIEAKIQLDFKNNEIFKLKLMGEPTRLLFENKAIGESNVRPDFIFEGIDTGTIFIVEFQLGPFDPRHRGNIFTYYAFATRKYSKEKVKLFMCAESFTDDDYSVFEIYHEQFGMNIIAAVHKSTGQLEDIELGVFHPKCIRASTQSAEMLSGEKHPKTEPPRSIETNEVNPHRSSSSEGTSIGWHHKSKNDKHNGEGWVRKEEIDIAVRVSLISQKLTWEKFLQSGELQKLHPNADDKHLHNKVWCRIYRFMCEHHLWIRKSGIMTPLFKSEEEAVKKLHELFSTYW
jgi:hypothetical protein